MKRIDLIRHLVLHGCTLLREGQNHSVYVNHEQQTSTTVPRHREINDFLCVKICKDLRIPSPFK